MTNLIPSFFLIGERKCGTSSLFRYLMMHPQVLPGRFKEPQFFTKHSIAYIEAHLDEYFALFPTLQDQGQVILEWPELDEAGFLYEEKVVFQRHQNLKYITGDASANALYELDPAILHRFFPDAKLILLFREPVSRAFSHYRMLRRFQDEGRDLGRYIGTFEEEVEREIKAFQANEPTELVGPGVYIEQAKHCQAYFSADQFGIYCTENMEGETSLHQIMHQTESVLALPHHDYGEGLKNLFNQAPPALIPSVVEQRLRAFYQPYNAALASHLNQILPTTWIFEKNWA